MMARWIANANYKLADVPSGIINDRSTARAEHSAERGTN